MAVLGSESQHASTDGDTARPTSGEGLMRAVVRDAYGSADVLRVEHARRPQIGESEVLVRVHAAGLDRGAWHLMTGQPYLLRLIYGLRRPKNRVLGREVAGTVVEVGSGVSEFSVGEDVFGIGEGSFAEYVRARADKLARKPANTSFEHAAVVSVSALTALQALTDIGRVQPGHNVLITGASGGMGSYAVQLAKAFGAHVTGVASTSKLDLIRALGADRVIDYTREDFADGTHRYDLIVDIAGNPSVSRLRRALTPVGTAVIAGGEGGGSWTGGIDRQLRALALSPFVPQRLTMVTCKERASDLAKLSQFIEAGTLTPSLDRTYALDDVPAAMRYLDTGKARGKVAVTI